MHSLDLQNSAAVLLNDSNNHKFTKTVELSFKTPRIQYCDELLQGCYNSKTSSKPVPSKAVFAPWSFQMASSSTLLSQNRNSDISGRDSQV